MTDPPILVLFEYGFKFNDLIAFATVITGVIGLIVTFYLGFSKRLDARRVAYHARESEEAKKQLRASILRAEYYDDGSQACHYFGLELRCGEDGIPHILDSCEILEPKTSYLRRDTEKSTRSRVINLLPSTIIGDTPYLLNLAEDAPGNISDPAILRFQTRRQDMAHTPVTLELKIPLGRNVLEYSRPSSSAKP
jgi:hypothetical protein